MKTYNIFIPFAVAFAICEACNWDYTAPQLTTLTNLLIPTPFTNVEDYNIANVTGCFLSPITFMIWRTAWVDGSSYPADPQSFSISIFNVSVTYTYPQLLLTLLRPGDLITMSDTFTPAVGVNNVFATTSEITLRVPASVASYVGAPTTSLSNTPSTSPRSTTGATVVQTVVTTKISEPLSNADIGGIVAGAVVVTVIAILAAAVVIYKLKSQKIKHSRLAEREMMDYNHTIINPPEGELRYGTPNAEG